MADVLLDTQSPSATPAAGQGVLFIDNVSKKFSQKNDAGIVEVMNGVRNANTADQAGFAADTYLAGASVLIPVSLLRVGSTYRCRFNATKTAAGVATPIIIARFGVAGTIADTARVTFTFPAQTAAIDEGWFDIWLVVRSIGAAGVVQGAAQLNHSLAATGFSVSNGPVVPAISAGFDTTVANMFIGLSVNGGAAAAWTVKLVSAELVGV